MTSSPSKGPLPNTITLRVRFSTYEFWWGGTNTLSIAEGVKREPFFKGYFLEVTEVTFPYLILARISPTPQNASREAENIVFISGVHVRVHVWEVDVEDKHLRKCDKI